MGHRRGRRMPGLAMTAMLVAVALSGCSLVGDGQKVWGILQEDAAMQEVLSAAVDNLRELDGIDEVTSRFLSDGPQGDEVDIHVIAKAGSAAAELVTVAETARAAFASIELAAATSTFSLTVGASSVLRTNALGVSAPVLAGEIRHWRAAEAVIGSELSVFLLGDGAEGYDRQIAPAADPGEEADFTERFLKGRSELLALDDTSTAPTSWAMPGMSATPGLPPAEAFALLETIRSGFSLSNPRATSEGASLWWQGQYGLMVIYAQDELRESDWPAVIALAQELISAGIPGSGFIYQTQTSADFTQYRFFMDECANEVTVGPDDRALADALAAAGTPIPATGGPGFCAWS